MCGRFYIAEEDKAEELQHIIDLMNRKYNGALRDQDPRRNLPNGYHHDHGQE